MSFTFSIAGAKHRSVDDQMRLKTLDMGEPLGLVPEPDNPFDANAIKVVSEDGRHLGYVPARLCAEVHSLLNGDGDAEAFWNGTEVEILSDEDSKGENDDDSGEAI